MPGFLLISGYFGIRFSWRKVFNLLSIAYGCYFLTIPFRPNAPSLLSLLLPHGAWFLPFYVVLMFFSPIFESALSNGGKRKSLYFYSFVLLMVGFLPTVVRNVHVDMLRIPGMQGNGMLLMVVTYFLGRWLREIQETLIARTMAFAAVPMLFVLWLGSRYFSLPCAYVSPYVIFAAMCGFCLFRYCFSRMPSWIERVICFISPSVFGIYLVHTCGVPHWWTCGGGAVIFRALGLFVFSLFVDLTRRGIVWSGMIVVKCLRERYLHGR